MKSKDILLLSAILNNPGRGNLLSISHKPRDENRLSDTLELRDVSERTPGNLKHLYRNGVKVSDELFRISGFGGKFKEGYCQLLSYYDTSTFWGETCLINEMGEIVWKVDKFNHIYHLGGIIISTKTGYFNLLTKEKICNSGQSSLSSKDFLFVDDYSKGVYKINFKTGETELFPKKS